MGPGPHRTLGERGESRAYRYLVDRGLRPVTRNFRSRGGEIDLIMLDRQCLVFVEVRCRQSSRFASPAATVDRRKQRKIIRTAALFLVRKPRFAALRMRFDVIAIEGNSVCWIRDAFRPEGSAF